ncbi:MAG TPA: hypothetical protein VFT22_33205 [Kofleriaceae bacterium]|nr:hypothetical protein [Kofleriaceae bacterium]
MLELSAATRAVAAETELRPAMAALQREARGLTRSQRATVVIIDWARQSAWTLEGSLALGELRVIVTRVASSGLRELFDHALVAPVGNAPARAVLALWRPSTYFEADDVALVEALTGGVAATLSRLLGDPGVPERPRAVAR